MTRFDYDLFVIGGGSGGVRAARAAAQMGARVAIAEEYRYGGTCVIRGCVPKKLFVYASEFGDAFADAAAYGWKTGDISFNWATLVANKDKEIDRLNQIYINMLDNAGVEVVHGRAVLTDPHTVEVDGKRLTSRVLLLATGARPHMPDIPGIEHAVSSNEAFHLPQFPGHITIGGGGYIAVEFAHIFRGLGANTTLVHRRDKVLTGFDEDVRTAVTEGLAHRGIQTQLESVIAAVEKQASGSLRIALKNGTSWETDVFMCAMGRWPNTNDMGLEALGVALNHKGAVEVDEYSRSSVDNIYAVGDCTDRMNLTPVAIREAQAFVDTVFGDRPTVMEHDNIATAVFSQPPVGTVGLTEAKAREQHGEIDVYRSSFRPLKHTVSKRDEQVMMKMLVDPKTQRMLGVHMVGHDAAEIIQCVGIAVRMGATKADFDATVAVHPTTAEELVLMKQKAA